MSGLAYRPDADAARDRLTTWWNGGDLGRPAMLLKVKREFRKKLNRFLLGLETGSRRDADEYVRIVSD